MFNSRDSITEINCNNEVRIPFGLRTVVESIEDPNVLARIVQYRFTVENYEQKLYVGLTTNLDDKESNVEIEISSDELSKNWKKNTKLVVGNIDPKNLSLMGGNNYYYSHPQDSEVIADYLDGLEYDEDKKDEVLTRFDGVTRKFKPNANK